ncbi:ClpXP protease specificity-enhancing factor [Azoarcus sp. DD4]|uniref:ClpXP protease specificity-enhancing factor n=1 Tax=Azoarcus sp. DD4 TaxID=2027405 RepID=UPI00112ED7AD|nr:ClpXP protease specificity-enhancing factor [Azoarcus sp. DD4]QDF96081.1 ClpXP protease specificity-enhancing factor [Azoarcus sp. DD4]
MSNVSTKPYLIRAIYEWCTDQGYTPYIAAMVDDNTRVPPGYARDGQIVLNVGQDATHQLVMDNELISFQARFNGTVHSLLIPVGNVVAIYARENGHGMAFELESGAVEAGGEAAEPVALVPAPAAAEPGGEGGKPPPRGNHLKVVK